MIAETPEAPTVTARPRARLRIFKAITISIGFALAIGFSEAALRVIEKSSAAMRTPTLVPDPRLGIRIVPNSVGHDANGFRNPTVPSQVDVVAIGDSQTWGVNVNAVDAWPQQLARLSGRSVYNMAVGGYGPDQYMVLSEQAQLLKPKTIIVGLYLGNDLYDAYASAYHLNGFEDLRSNENNNELAQDQILKLSNALADEQQQFHYTYGRNSPLTWGVWLREHTAIGRLLNRTSLWQGASDIDYEIDKAWVRAHPDHGLVCEDDQIRTVFTPAYRLTGLDLNDVRVAEGLRITKVVLSGFRKN
jgi:hypothetical protein